MFCKRHSAIHYLSLLGVLLSSSIPNPVSAQYASSFPSPMSIITKTAYLHSWMQINSTFSSDGHTPFFWGRQNLGWMNAIRVDGASYSLMSAADNFKDAQGLAAAITPTRSVLTMQAGSVNLNLTYLSPIEPSDWVLQSLPFGYLSIDVWSTDNKPHSVQLYSDISGEWISGNPGNIMTWDTTTTPKSKYHQAARQQRAPMGEVQGIAEDSTVYLAMPLSTPGLTWQTASFNVSRPTFAEKGKLDNSANTTYRAIGDDWPVLAFATDLGNIQKTSSPVVYALGLVRDPVLTYRRNGALENRPPLFRTRWKKDADAIDDFLADFSKASSRAVDFDTKIMIDAGKTSTNYSDLIAASLRQTMAPLEFTTAPNGGPDGEVRVFLKDLGTSQRVNPVDTLYAAFPAYLYLNASLAGHLLEPLLEFQSSSSYTNAYAAPDIGSWPNVFGNSTDESALAVESCGSMLVMALAHAQKSGDGALIQKYNSLLKGWADYLVTNTLVPTGYISADNTSSTTSNLALKGITGIWAMSKISQALESTGTQNNLSQSYLTTAQDYAKQWQTRAFLGDHIASDYGSGANWGLIYNLYAPKLLNSDLIPQNIFDTQASWYSSQLPKAPAFGFPFDQSAPDMVKAHWTLMTAASVANSSVMHDLIAQAHKRAFSQSLANYPNPSTYDSIAGLSYSYPGKASPAMGAAFSLLALGLPDLKINIPIPTAASTKQNAGPIVGGLLGGLAFLLLAVSLALFIRRRRQHNTKFERVPFDKVEAAPRANSGNNTAPIVTPFVGMPSASSNVSSYPYQTSRTSKFGGTTNATGPTSPTDTRRDVTSPTHTSRASSSGNTYFPDSYTGDSKTSLFPERWHMQNQISLTRTDFDPSNPLTSPIQHDDLRSEVAQLRRELSSIRRGEDLPPPVYTDRYLNG